MVGLRSRHGWASETWWEPNIANYNGSMLMSRKVLRNVFFWGILKQQISWIWYYLWRRWKSNSWKQFFRRWYFWRSGLQKENYYLLLSKLQSVKPYCVWNKPLVSTRKISDNGPQQDPEEQEFASSFRVFQPTQRTSAISSDTRQQQWKA